MATTKNIDEIASVYAQSLLEVCDRQGGNAAAESCAEELRDFAEIVRADKRFAEFLKTPILGNDKRRAALDRWQEILEDGVDRGWSDHPVIGALVDAEARRALRADAAARLRHEPRLALSEPAPRSTFSPDLHG